MNAERLSHRGVVQAIDGEHALVAVDTGGCSSCGHGSSCGVGQMASGRAATVLRVPAQSGLRAGDPVTVSVPVRALTASALLGYVLPALLLLVGAGVGSALGSDLAAVLGALAGFLGAMLIGRLLVALMPGLRPSPQLEAPFSPHFPKEFHHE
jgi:sigma-E factor negative regulatory protein RseC